METKPLEQAILLVFKASLQTFILFSLLRYICLYPVYVHVTEYTDVRHMHLDALEARKGIRSLKLKFQENISLLELVLGIQSLSSCRATVPITVEPFSKLKS